MVNCKLRVTFLIPAFADRLRPSAYCIFFGGGPAGGLLLTSGTDMMSSADCLLLTAYCGRGCSLRLRGANWLETQQAAFWS